MCHKTNNNSEETDLFTILYIAVIVISVISNYNR